MIDTQTLQKLIYVYLSSGCFVKGFLHSSGPKNGIYILNVKQALL